MPRINFQWRLMLLLFALVAVVQFPSFLAVSYAIHRNVVNNANRDLDLGTRVFSRLLATRGTQLRDTVQIAASDFGFREAVATGDEETVRSVLVNHGDRINASFAMMLAPDGRVTASTTDVIAEGAQFPLHALLERARRGSLVSDVAALDEQPFQIVLAPVRAPERIGWVSMGFAIDQGTVKELRDLIGLDVSIATFTGGHFTRLYSTLPEDAGKGLRAALAHTHPVGANAFQQQGYLSRMLPLSSNRDDAVWAVLQSSSAQAMAPYGVLKEHLLVITLLSLALSMLGAWLLARGVTHPVRTLAAAARRVGRGDYLDVVAVKRNDELGELADVFNSMQLGIAEREKRIAHQAFHDALTGLPNRASIEAHLASSIESACASGESLAVVILDVNRFKEINDTLGHRTGDHLLIGLGQRLRATVRDCDKVARLGGDEFLIVLANADSTAATALALQLAQSATQSMRLDCVDLYPELSIGIAVYPEHGENGDDLVRRADIAMYDAKHMRLPLAVYELGRDATHLRRFSLINELRRAVVNNELCVHYQPTLRIGEHYPAHVEALVRWQHPAEGLLLPDEFIPLAEHAGTIHLITDWVLRRVIRQCREWADAGLDIGVAVNLSAMDLAIGTLPGKIRSYLDEYGVPASRLLLEITESAVMRDADHALDVLGRLRDCGVRLAIDDFGTGYSSLAHLKRLPVDELKIDKSFVMNMTNDAEDAVIVRSTIELGHNMGLSIVAEGVENAASLDMLERYHCDMVQGYLISRPLPPDKLTEWLIERCRSAPVATLLNAVRARS